MIKFNDYNVTNTETKEKARIHYSLDNRVDKRKCVTLYEKNYDRNLHKIFANAQNDTDTMTDYFENSRVTIFEGDKHYEAARKAAEKKSAKDKARWEKRFNKVA
jgi:hypothetical protein